MERNHKNRPSNYLIIYMIVGFFIIIVGFFITLVGFHRFVAEPRCSFNDGQKISSLMPSPVSGDTQTTPTRIAVSPSKVHQVFLNFRGEEMRYEFVDHLSKALHRNKIKFFLDEHELRGKDLKHLFVRIQESTIALVVFSKRYAESKWCMSELLEIKKLVDEGKLLVIPIFFKLEAEDVRKPTLNSEFGRNFLSLAEASNPGEVKEWKKALESICNKMGLTIPEKSYQSAGIEEIVKALQRVIEAMELEDEEIIEGK